MFFDPSALNDLSDQTRGYLPCRLMFGRVVQDKTSAGWADLGDFGVNVSVDDLLYTDVPIPNPNPLVSGTRDLAAVVGDTVMLLQFIDGTLICLGRTNV